MFDFFNKKEEPTPFGTLDPRLRASLKTSYQSTLEATLTAAAIAFANRNYVEEFDEKDLVCKAAKIAEYVAGVTIDRMIHSINRRPGDPPYDPAEYFYGKDDNKEVFAGQQSSENEPDDDELDSMKPNYAIL